MKFILSPTNDTKYFIRTLMKNYFPKLSFRKHFHSLYHLYLYYFSRNIRYFSR